MKKISINNMIRRHRKRSAEGLMHDGLVNRKDLKTNYLTASKTAPHTTKSWIHWLCKPSKIIKGVINILYKILVAIYSSSIRIFLLNPDTNRTSQLRNFELRRPIKRPNLQLVLNYRTLIDTECLCDQVPTL